jgi:hypothetical protein
MSQLIMNLDQRILEVQEQIRKLELAKKLLTAHPPKARKPTRKKVEDKLLTSGV